jgi:predicted dehydrogenase
MIGIGLFGHNGHQLSIDSLWDGATIVAVCDVPSQVSPKQYGTFDELLEDSHIHLVAICAPRRDQQVHYIRRALLAGKHVIAEKPCLMLHDDIHEVVALAQRVGRHFFEMSGSVDEAPYVLIAPLITQGLIGEIGQVCVRKSYPYADWRPQDEGVDGGLVMQCGIHALRMIAHITGLRVVAISAVETKIGNPDLSGELIMAVSISARLSNGAVASVAANYYNPRAHGRWADDELRIYGRDGMIVTGQHNEVHVITHESRTTLQCPVQPHPFQHVIDVINQKSLRTRDIVWDLHPTHAVIAAKDSARHDGMWINIP